MIIQVFGPSRQSVLLDRIYKINRLASIFTIFANFRTDADERGIGRISADCPWLIPGGARFQNLAALDVHQGEEQFLLAGDEFH